MNNAIRPLPLSLAPILDESLPGYIMRLAHRLCLSPRELAFALGISERGKISPSLRHYLELDPAVIRQFAHMTRLSPQEVERLTYMDLRGTYPAVDPSSYRGKGTAMRHFLPGERWLFTAATRYCPECLVGDGSEIQNEHGGGWNRLWRLLTSFACTTHERILDHRCHQCDLPALSKSPVTHSQLIPDAGAHELHPLECRVLIGQEYLTRRHGRSRWLPPPRCAGRFDTPRPDPATVAGLEHSETAALLDLQRRLNTLLHSNPASASALSAGESVPAAEFFADLRIVVTLMGVYLRSGKSRAELHALSPGIPATLIDKTAAYELAHPEPEEEAALPATLRRKGPAPLDALECATRLALATHLLETTANSQELSDKLQLFVRSIGASGSTSSYLKQWTGPTKICSPAMRVAASKYQTGTSKAVAARENRARCEELVPHVDKPERLRQRHIAQILQRDIWLHRFPHAEGVDETPQRRLASAVMLAAIANVKVTEAAKRLSIPETVPSTIAPFAEALGSTGMQEFHDAIRQRIAELDGRGDLVDLERRRVYLRSWIIPRAHWQLALKRADLTATKAQTDTSLRILTIYVWARVTQGDPRLAPQRIGDGSLLWKRLESTHADPITRIGQLRESLNAYADDLARYIDINIPRTLTPESGHIGTPPYAGLASISRLADQPR